MNVLVFDIETAPIIGESWRLYETTIPHDAIVEPTRTLCVAWKWYQRTDSVSGVRFASDWTDRRRDLRAMLRAIHDELSAADAVVGYNSDRFDVRHLNREFLLAGMPPPRPFKSIDLYRTVKRRFAFDSGKLEHVAARLGFRADIPGSTYGRYLEMAKYPVTAADRRAACWGDPAAQRKIEQYNQQDVALTELVYERLLPWIERGPNAGLYVDGDEPICPACGSPRLRRDGHAFTSAGKFQQYKCRDCNKRSRSARRVATTALREVVS